MGILKQYKLVKKGDNKTPVAFENLFPNSDFTTIAYSSPLDYVNKYWNAYNASQYRNNALNGTMFELIIETLLIRENIRPFYIQAQFSFVPAAIFDVVLYSEKNNRVTPFVLSIKTSLRERWKQADLEAMALKHVHRNAKCYLLTKNSNEANRVKTKIKNGDTVGLDEVVDCNTTDIDNLIRTLRQVAFKQSPNNINPIASGPVIQ